MSADRYDVAIVGFGPAGAVAACWLGQFGIKTVVVEKSRTIWEIPRAIALDHEIMRTFQNLGVVEQILPHTAPFAASEHFGVDGQLIRKIDVVPPPYPQGYTPTLVFTQPKVEAILRRHAAAYPSVSVRLGAEVVGLRQDAEQVYLDVRDDTGAASSIEASYVIACDGASSPVRQRTGLTLEDLGFDEPWMVIDVMVQDAALGKLPHTAAQYCSPERPTTFIIGPGNHRRWEIMLNPDEHPREMEKPENVWRLLAPWIAPSDGTLWRAGSYRFHALVADRWRAGRVFLAGDAAHQQPPFIGQGMCQGIRDVTNLCWKLEAVLSDEAPQTLLDTYGEERKLHVRTLTSRIKAIGRHICERDPAAARRRDEALLQQGGGSAPVVTRQEIVPPLAAGLLTAADHKARGTLFPQPAIETPDGQRLLDEIAGHGWRLVLDGRKAPPEALAAIGISVITVGGDGLQERDAILARWFDAKECSAALVRPDHYVFGAASNHAAIPALLTQWRFAVTPTSTILAIA
jgi:3-(3-hydroxy-phenyl)propionate hydroxylase